MFSYLNAISARRARRLALPGLVVIVPALILLASNTRSPLAIHQSQADPSTQQTTLTVDVTRPGVHFPLSAVGLSIEADELATRDLSASHRSLVSLMRMLGPGVIRIGGNSLDYSRWTSGDESLPAWATSAVTHADLVGLHGLLAATGWRVILGLDLGHFDPNRAAKEAGVARHILGSRLLGFELGNEPDEYGNPLVRLRPSSYSPGDYLKEVAVYRRAITAAAAPVRLYGPDLVTQSSHPWLTAIAADRGQPFVAITQHYYPTTYSVAKGACKGTPVPTAAELLSRPVRERETLMLRTLEGAGKLARRPTRISETNTTSSCDVGGGPATSPVFASALWSLDWVLRAVSAGVSGLNLHGYFGRCGPYVFSPICAPNSAAEDRGQVIPRPEYYGLLAARQLSGGRFLPIKATGLTSTQEFTAYATQHSRAKITMVIDNFANNGSTSLLLKVPGYHRASAESLLAPSISATSDVTLGGSSIDLDGNQHPLASTLHRSGSSFRVTLAPYSAAVVTILH